MSGSLTRIIAAALVFALVPAPMALAQSRDTDQALKDLIPDSAIDNAESWALDTDAARQPAPDVAALLGATEPLQALTDIPGITIDWPQTADLPPFKPLDPDPDIALAQQQVDGAVDALDGEQQQVESARNALIPDASLSHVGGQVDLAFSPTDAFPERDELVSRFSGLSSLHSLDDDEDNLAQLTRRARSDRDLIVEILRTYGYYDAEVYQSIVTPQSEAAASAASASAEGGNGARRGPRRNAIDLSKVVVRFDVVPGPQYRLAKIDLGDIAGTGADYKTLRAAFGVRVGDPVNTEKILKGRADLAATLGDTGYAFAKVGEPALVIDHEPRTGDLTVPVTSGGRYVFGQVVSGMPRFMGSRHIQHIARFRPGDVYQTAMLDDLRQAILATSLVSSVTVKTREVTPPAAGKPGVVDVDVDMAKAPQRTVAALIGYSSGEGFRVEASWEHRNLIPPEGMVRVRGVAGTREQLLGVIYRRNNFLTRDQVLTADLYAQTKVSDAYQARTLSLVSSIERQTTLLFQKPWVYSAGLEVVATSEREDSTQPRKTYFIGALPLRGAYDGSDSLLDPTRGFRAALRVSPEISRQAGANSTYVKVQLDASLYRPVSDSVVMAGRVRFGAIQGADIASIAPSRRFYAGGGSSVRGYGYQQIGPRDTTGAPSGGRSLTEFSLEARVKTGLMGGAVSVVPFVDAGAVDETTTPRFRDIKVGVGVGIRYQTNFGPIRIDLGTPLNPSKGDSRIGVYVALGQAF
ncbi:autotransporter assembly complex family protein [Novosphingobium sp.]|uniref:autotransporter assembly complex protein TamA n=1 Tax=Novosphingobium sp. TaxID=1874826 RepID=UPI00352A7019